MAGSATFARAVTNYFALGRPRWRAALSARRGAYIGLLGLLGVGQASGCGSKTDLVIGSNFVAGGASTGGSAAAGADASNAGAEVGGSAGSVAGGAGGTEPNAGQAGLGDAGASDAGASNCDPLDVAPGGSLVHRYSFDGAGGSFAVDSIGSADGTLMEATGPTSTCTGAEVNAPGAVLDGNGRLVLDGCKGYVDFPNHLFAMLNNVTLVIWAKWSGGSAFQRYFDFGVGAGENVTTGQGSSYLAVETAGLNPTQLQLLVRQAPTSPEQQIPTLRNMNDKLQHQVALVFASNAYTELYRDGQRLGRLPITWSLGSISDVNNWIGRSQWASDHTFGGTVDEFRIYDQALSPCAMQALYAAGPHTL